ncbi:NnrU family protein [Thalassotalea mangrovi]|uniref:DUF1295 domain-containing protein n=1 Tax=Thalassotalea mangrovi TaxID=2572245 RepID=A0A4U1B9A8_9GAMM|nr:NnrU family protein [Thalassotalea mangrovi]TKB47155.1 DUF1295 domain-containing protein [Thalassotalea mangrovi]
MNSPLDVSTHIDSGSLSKRFLVLIYGILAYVVGCIGLFWLILGAGSLVPIGISNWRADSTGMALMVNIGLILLFAIQHTVMARGAFKARLTQLIPEAAERPTFMLLSGIVVCILLYFWQSVPGVIWQVQNQIAVYVIYGLYLFGVIYLLLSTLVTNHFELMGLRQVYLYFRKTPYTPLPFTNKYMYRYSRHPMMLGVLILLWSVPVMSATRLVMSVLFTLYIAVGIYFEERDLNKNFGETYAEYKRRIAAFIPGVY